MDQQEQLFDELSDKALSSQQAAPQDPRDAASDATIIAQIHAIVRAIPEGRVMSYGAVGARCNPPISGYICGRIMNNAVSNIPWWRVVAKDGALPIGKRNAQLAQEQRSRLSEENITFDEAGRVAQSHFDM